MSDSKIIAICSIFGTIIGVLIPLVLYYYGVI